LVAVGMCIWCRETREDVMSDDVEWYCTHCGRFNPPINKTGYWRCGNGLQGCVQDWVFSKLPDACPNCGGLVETRQLERSE